MGSTCLMGIGFPLQEHENVLEVRGSRCTTLNGLNCSLFFFFGLFRAAPTAYRSSQARGQIRAVVASHSHSHAKSEPHLQPTPQLTATQDP